MFGFAGGARGQDAGPAAVSLRCAECHDAEVAAILRGPHASISRRDAAFCTACHGDPGAHLESASAEDIRGGDELAKWSGERQAAACVQCHAREFPAWRQAAHLDEGLCWSCHASEATHGEEARVPPLAGRRAVFDRCTSCHRDVALESRMAYHHPMESGVIGCTSCHDIHGRSVQTATQGVADQTCLGCHEEQKGPFLFEHSAMEQGCSNCHAPHGSPHRGQLRTAGSGTCVGCHAQSNFPTVGAAS
ncbi:MAG TPA: cytochrome c3 family protein, partial [Thermoanaerobaculia bacterium]|nr:cytochrome c3 family protein [Thermoanaerobaculia bacterium]